MKVIIKIVGILIVLLGLLYLLKPDFIKTIMSFIKKGKRIYLAGILRFALSIIFLLGAGECYQKWMIAAFGIMFLISGLLIFLLGPERIRRILDWYQNQPVLIFRIIAVMVLACGAVIVYSA
ncbi:MAG: DUF2065 family protein [Sedimentisphaerales bacterium]|nr:DUF2065 family protein [Sedimentisphaerales bacterium]